MKALFLAYFCQQLVDSLVQDDNDVHRATVLFHGKVIRSEELVILFIGLKFSQKICIFEFLGTRTAKANADLYEQRMKLSKKSDG